VLLAIYLDLLLIDGTPRTAPPSAGHYHVVTSCVQDHHDLGCLTAPEEGVKVAQTPFTTTICCLKFRTVECILDQTNLLTNNIQKVVLCLNFISELIRICSKGEHYYPWYTNHSI